MNIKNKLKRLIKKECASYDREWCGINHYCCMVDSACLFFRDNETISRCKYFEQGVLPLDEELERLYYSHHSTDRGNTTKNKAKPKIKCERCGENIEANSNRQKYCERCKKYNDREKAKLRKQKARRKEHDVTI